MYYKEKIWDDLMDFKLPDPEKLREGALSINELSRVLSEITNYMVDLSQYEPGLVYNVGSLKIEIAEKEREQDQEFQYDFANEFTTIPETHKKNLDLQRGYVRNKLKEKYEEYNSDILKLRKTQLFAEKRYNQLHRRLSLSKTVLDVGRSVLSALKEEIRALGG